MKKTFRKKKSVAGLYHGLTLIEAMIAMVTISILAIGGLSFYYHSIKHLRTSQADLAATRIGQLVLENWKGLGGVDTLNYDLSNLGLGFEKTSGTADGDYYTMVDGTAYYVWLGHQDRDEQAGVTLRQITATLRWPADFTTRSVTDDDPKLILTTYLRRGQN